MIPAPLQRGATRRAVLRALAALGTVGAVGAGSAGCALPWGAGGTAGPAALPTAGLPTGTPRAAPSRYGRERLRLVVSPEGLPALDRAVSDAIAGAVGSAGSAGIAVEVQDVAAFLGDRSTLGGGSSVGGELSERGGGDDVGAAVAHRLLVAVQAGVPPDAVLLLGREAQVARFQGAGLVQDLSGLMRHALRRLGGVPRVGETLHVVAGNWFAVPWYQRLVGHWVRDPVAREAGIDPDGAVDYAALRRMLSRSATSGAVGTLAWIDPRAGGGPPQNGGPWPWGVGAADTPDVDAWCWGAIHAWGGGLADLKGERVALDSSPTVEALQWLAGTVGDSPWRADVHPDAARWSDGAKNAAFLAGATAYTYTERALLSALTQGAQGEPAGGSGDALAGALYLRPPSGPVARPRSVGGGAAWLLPRGAPAEPVERLLEALLEPAVQRRLWEAGGGFALPAYHSGWADAGLNGSGLLGATPIEHARRFRDELGEGGFVSATGNGGPETAASQAIGTLRFGTGMLRAVLGGRPAAAVVAETHARAVDIFRSFGLPGA